MYCPSCGTAIPTESRFCMYCGVSVLQTNSTSDRRAITYTPPKYIQGFNCKLNGITEKNKDGFILWFTLVDSTGKPTAADGELLIKVKPVGYFVGTFQTSVFVRPEDFVRSESDPAWFGYKFHQVEPKLEQSPTRDGYKAEIVFKASTGLVMKAEKAFYS